MIVQVYVAAALPPGPVAVATNVWVPAASEDSDVGLVHAAAVPLSSLHVTEVALLVTQASVAVVAVVDEDGVCVKEIVGGDQVGVLIVHV